MKLPRTFIAFLIVLSSLFMGEWGECLFLIPPQCIAG